MKRKAISYDHRDLQAGDKGVLISLVHDFQTGQLVEYRTGYEVSTGPMIGFHVRPGCIVYRMPNHHIKATGEYTKTMSVERIGQYELMRVKAQHGMRFYARMFTIPLRYHHDRAEFWQQLYRRLSRQRCSNPEISNLYARIGEPLTKPNF